MVNPWAPPEQSPPPGGRTSEPTGQTGQTDPPAPPQAAPGAAPQHPDHGAGTPAPAAPAPLAPGGTGAPGPGPLPPPPPHVPRQAAPPDPAGVARATRTGAWTAAALLASVLLMTAPYPGLLLAPLAAGAALVLAIVAVVRANRARARGAVVALPVVLVVASLAWVAISTQGLLYVDARRTYERCEAGALTQRAQRACATQLQVDMRERTESVLGRLAVRDTA